MPIGTQRIGRYRGRALLEGLTDTGADPGHQRIGQNLSLLADQTAAHAGLAVLAHDIAFDRHIDGLAVMANARERFEPDIGPLRADVAVTGPQRETFLDLEAVAIGQEGVVLNPHQDRMWIALRLTAGRRIQSAEQRRPEKRSRWDVTAAVAFGVRTWLTVSGTITTRASLTSKEAMPGGLWRRWRLHGASSFAPLPESARGWRQRRMAVPGTASVPAAGATAVPDRRIACRRFLVECIDLLAQSLDHVLHLPHLFRALAHPDVTRIGLSTRRVDRHGLRTGLRRSLG